MHFIHSILLDYKVCMLLYCTELAYFLILLPLFAGWLYWASLVHGFTVPVGCSAQLSLFAVLAPLHLLAVWLH